MAAITVRSRLKDHHGKWRTDWVEETRSWTKAWSIVDSCHLFGGEIPFDLPLDERIALAKAQDMEHRKTCRKWRLGDEWFLDVGGVEEHNERMANLARLLG